MRVALALLLAVSAATSARAQAPPAGAPASEPQAATATPEVDAAKMGVSMSRIQKGLRMSQTREGVSATPFRLEYQIQVFGAAPRLDIIKDFNVGQVAPLSYGAPTHSEFLNHWTPQAYRAPTAPLGALAGWALFQLAKRADKSKCEQEIADYRALVMQGISAPAPRCAQ